jgi:hypothetical protein
MNGQEQETRETERHIPEDRRRHIVVVLARMIHQRLTASRPDSTEGAPRKRRE